MKKTVKHANTAVKLTLATAVAFGGATAAPKEAEACEVVCIGILSTLAVMIGNAIINNDAPPASTRTTPAPTPPAGVLTWETTGEPYEVRNGLPQIITVPEGVPIQIGNEIANSEEIGFSRANGTAISGGVSAGLQADFQTSWQTANEGKIEEGNIQTLSATLNWDVCDTWQVNFYKTVQDGQLTAPQHGITTPIHFHVTMDQRLAVENLCELGTNIATPEAIAAAEAQIEELRLEN